MLNAPETIRVSAVLASCLAAIARCEQDLHAARRSDLAAAVTTSASTIAAVHDQVDALLTLLNHDHALIEAEVERLAIQEDLLIDAPGMSAAAILKAVETIPEPAIAYSPDPASMPHWLAPRIVLAQLLDTWLEPAINLHMDLNRDQAEFRNAFDLDGYLSLPDGALLLPRHRQSWRNDQECVESAGIFARHFRNFAYIPADLDCDDPDMLRHTGTSISASYQLWNSALLQARPVPPEPKIAVAPLAERGSDIAFAPSPCRTKYGLHLSYDETRFAAALTLALEQGVHILLVPEMAIPEGDPVDFDDRMRQLFLDVQADYFARSGRIGELRFVLAGVLGNTRDDGYHRNYAVAFDAQGEQPADFRQLKLSHWNLTRSEQDRFGITNHLSPGPGLSDPIIENSMPARQLAVLEIPGVGRTATLICADMSQNNPGDWLSINAVLDWLYAPIMDKSICWQIADRTTTRRPWIVERTYRSARLTGTMVITTNSMSLSRWVNQANRLAGSSWPPYSEVGIGLAIDGRSNPPIHDHLTVSINSTAVVGIFSPTLSWTQFPTSPA